MATDPPRGRRLALASLDLELVLGDRRVQLATHEWTGAVIDPRGYTHLASFELVDGVPRTLGGCQLDADTTVMVSIPLVHQRPELYPEPAPLRPERFLGHHPKPHEWVPFGGGARRCIGADLAMFEMKTVLATVLAEADLSAERAAPEHTRLLGTALRPSRRAAVVLAHPVS